MLSTLALASFKCMTYFVLISICVSSVRAIAHHKLPVYKVNQVCQNELLLSSVRENVATTLQDITQNFFNNLPQCGSGLWKRIANLNMSDSSNNCPANWTFYTLSSNNVRSCGRSEAERSGESCTSIYFSSGNYEYNRVCGRATGYQIHSTDTFGPSQGCLNFPHTTINNAYVDGLSLTHGRARTHIWTFAAGHGEARNSHYACYCGDSSTHGQQPPMFVGRNFFCESAVNTNSSSTNIFYAQDPLWDGQNCPHSNCCSFNNPPWFSVQLPTSTTDDIEARICLDENSQNEDLTIALLEIYVQ